MKHPDQITDEHVGTLRYEQDAELYNGQFLYNEQVIDIHISVRHCDDVVDLIHFVDGRVEDISNLVPKASKAVVHDLLALKNERWLKEGEAPVAADAFYHRLLLKAVTGYANKNVDLWFSDDGMFWGHDIRVRINADGSLRTADLVG